MSWIHKLNKIEKKRLRKHLKTSEKKSDSALLNTNHLQRDMSKGKGRYGKNG